MRYGAILLALLAGLVLPVGAWSDAPVVVGSKKFNESYILAEIFAQLLEARGVSVERKFGLGGTLVCFEALKSGEIDVYPEYSGTLEQAVLKLDRRVSYAELGTLVTERFAVYLLEPFGFNNTYALTLSRRLAGERGLVTISDLARAPDLRLAFSHEFLNRRDGWVGLARAYGLPHAPTGIEHGLAYAALNDRSIDVTDAYSTDGDIPRYDLATLVDEREFFPKYLAAPVVGSARRTVTAPVMNQLAGRIDDARMQRLNAAVLVEGHTFAEVARAFLAEEHLLRGTPAARAAGFWETLMRRTVTHLKLTAIALIVAMAVAIPMGVFIYHRPTVARPVLYVTGSLQTIPSIALLAFMIPLFGIGAAPAIVALFLYALLPILRNTATALFAIDPVLKKVGVGMGLTVWERLRHVEMPLAAPTILAGVRTAAVINIGTATLAAFIGAGGLGEPIVTGLALNDTTLIMEGAIPAALLAILTELAFELIEKLTIPKHLLQQTAR